MKTLTLTTPLMIASLLLTQNVQADPTILIDWNQRVQQQLDERIERKLDQDLAARHRQQQIYQMITQPSLETFDFDSQQMQTVQTSPVNDLDSTSD